MNRALLGQTFRFHGVIFQEYRCVDVGDGLALHDHPFNHLTLCLEGEIEAFTDDGKTAIARPGDAPLEYVAGRKHGIRALTAGARLLNISPVLS